MLEKLSRAHKYPCQLAFTKFPQLLRTTNDWDLCSHFQAYWSMLAMKEVLKKVTVYWDRLLGYPFWSVDTKHKFEIHRAERKVPFCLELKTNWMFSASAQSTSFKPFYDDGFWNSFVFKLTRSIEVFFY